MNKQFNRSQSTYKQKPARENIDLLQHQKLMQCVTKDVYTKNLRTRKYVRTYVLSKK